MVSMAEVFRVASTDMFKGLKARDKVNPGADHVNGTNKLTKIKKR